MWDPNGNFNLDADENYEMDSEKVMKEIQYLYKVCEFGLRDTAQSISEKDRNFKVTMPQNKITVLLAGSHNTAKQKFLSLYFSEPRELCNGGFVQKVNYDKLDKIYITHGTRRRFLMGETVLDYCPHLSTLKNVPGLKDYLTTEIAAQSTKSFVSFILAPNESKLVAYKDSNSNVESTNSSSIFSTPKSRSLDLKQAISQLTQAADLVFVFFDPSGTVKAKDTLQPFESVWEAHHDKILLLLVRTEEDDVLESTREEVVSDIVREIWRNSTVRKTGYLPEIYCPDLSSGIRDDERLWSVIQSTADQSVEKALNQLEMDAQRVKDRLEQINSQNIRAMNEGLNEPLLSLYMLMVLLGVGIAVLWSQEPGQFSCKINGQDYSICSQALENRTFVTAVLFILGLLAGHSAYNMQRPKILTEKEAELLKKRIAFANHVLLRKERMANLYVGINLN